MDDSEDDDDDDDPDEEDPDDPYGDGFGDDLMGDAADRARLAGMTELEREEILADRRDARAKIQDRKRIIQMARDKKQREEGAKKKKFKPANEGRKSSRVAGGDAERERSKTSRALADIAKKKSAASRRRAADVEDDEDDEASSDDEDEDLDEDELDGVLPPRERKAAGGRGGRGAGGAGRHRQDSDEDDVSDEEDDEEDGGGDRVPASEVNIRKIVLRRETLERWISEPFFADCAPGCFVRIGTGVGSSGQNKYRLAEIAEVVEGKHGHYTLGSYEYVPRSGKVTNRWVILRFGAAERAFRITEISNSEVQPNEFLEWQQQMAKDGRRGPLLRDVAAAEEQMKRAENYRYTSEDVNKMIQEKNQSMGGLSHNLAGQKEILRRLIERATSEGDDAAVAQLQEQLAQVMTKLNAKLDKGGAQKALAAINKRNNQLNDVKLSRIAAQQVARAKSGAPDESANDPFSRRPTRAATYYTISSDPKKNQTAAGQNTDPAPDAAQAKTPNAIKTSGGKQGGGGGGPKTPRTPKSGFGAFSNAAHARLNALTEAHTRASLTGVDPSLASRPDPVSTVGLPLGLRPVLRRGLLGVGDLSSSLLAGVVPVPPKGRSLTVQEYLARIE